MAALTAPRDTRRKGPSTDSAFNHPVAANAVIYKGALVALNATGYLVPATTATDITVIGRADPVGGIDTVDNTGGADGDLECEVRSHARFAYVNDPGDPITQAGVGKLCYATDDQTVAGTSGGATKSPAGYVAEIDADTSEVWVLCLPHALA